MDAILTAVEGVRTQRRREEDLCQRQLENSYRLIETARREVDKKAEQLKTISSLAALIAGFAMVVLVESNIDHFDNEPLLVCFGSITAVVVGLMLLSMTNTALILVAVLNFDCMASVQLQSLSFEHFWRARCEDEWIFAFKCFSAGVPCFIVSLALLGWVKFYESPATAGVITIVSSICIIIWLIHTIPNWGNSAIQHVSKYDEHEMPPTPPNGLDGMGDGNASRDTMMDLRGIIDASDDGVCKAGKEDIDVGVGMMRETSTNDTVHNGTHSNRDEHTSHHINGEGDGKGVEEMGTSAKLMRGLSSYFLGSSTHTNNNSSSNARQSPSRSQQYRPNEQSTHPHRHAQSPASEQQHMSSFSDGMDAFGRFHNAHYHNQMRRHQYHRNRHHSQAGSPARADGE